MEIGKELNDQQFFEIISNAPLVSIDIIVRDKKERILLGLRKNEPAKNTWFVPGGRIKKDEPLDVAFNRITKNELGVYYNKDQARFIGVFENIYNNNFFGAGGIGTHYIVLAYEIRPPEIPETFPLNQNTEFKWFAKDDVKNHQKDTVIHPYVLPYFDIVTLTDTQYTILNARRDSFNSLVWRAPVLSLTAQAFLFTIALNPDVTVYARGISASLAFITAIASIQLLCKQRFHEMEYARFLERFENSPGMYPINKKSLFTAKGRLAWLENRSSFKIWFLVLCIFALFSLCILLTILLNFHYFDHTVLKNIPDLTIPLDNH